TRKFDRRLQNGDDVDLFRFETQFQVESYLHYQGKKLVQRFDANSYLYLTRALDLFDLSRGYGSYEEALSRIRCPMLMVGVDSDILYPTYQQREIVDILTRLGRPAEYVEMKSPWGHDSFLIDFDQLGDIIRSFLNEI